ncbi:MAG: lipase [Alphaproteobacteria bacterium]|nr:MAG: lipase [Alphaproteobacteria bacterium]
MPGSTRTWSRATFILAALFLTACAQLSGTVRVNVGVGLIEDQPAPNYAALYLPYARMASIAYTDVKFLKGGAGPTRYCPDAYRLAHERPDTRDQAERNPNNLEWLNELQANGWRCIYALNDPRECPADNPSCDPVRGLELHVWMKGCEAVIAFRGTDYDQRGDWQSNLRWFLGPLHLFDEYRQVEFHMSSILGRISRVCRSAHIVTTGHSLGGGLAQRAAYSAGGRIRFVYAFDPSPVVGYFDLPREVRIKARTGLGIDQVYEVGEVLDFPRFFLGGFANPQPCNPRVRIVRFNLTNTGSAVEQHAMQALTRKMERPARYGNPAKAREESKARDCTFVTPAPV